MKRPQITPGPFVLKEGRNIETPSGTFYLAYGHEKGTSRPLYSSPVELDAIARAIAAIPNLLDTLEACLQSSEDCWKLTNGECGGTRDIGTRNLIGEKIDWIKNALRLAGYEF